MASLTASTLGLDQIIQFEISSPTFYNQRLTKPIWPGGSSGVTIGIGYDLGYNTKAKIKSDWQNQLSNQDLDDLLQAAGKTGDDAKKLVPKLSHIRVPLNAATQVFYNSTLPRYAKDTARVYPGVANLPADAQTMLLSLVFNRGTAMIGDRRREMRAIKPLVANKELVGIADQIRSMKRLWNIEELPGLHKRRDKEAALIESARTSYPPGALISI
jgi:hypothetical protein